MASSQDAALTTSLYPAWYSHLVYWLVSRMKHCGGGWDGGCGGGGDTGGNGGDGGCPGGLGNEGGAGGVGGAGGGSEGEGQGYWQ